MRMPAGDEAVVAALNRDRRRPTCDAGFYAAQRLALDDWRRWVEGEGVASARMQLARAAATPAQAGQGSIIRRFRQAVGAVLIAAGRNVQGTASPVADPDSDGAVPAV